VGCGNGADVLLAPSESNLPVNEREITSPADTHFTVRLHGPQVIADRKPAKYSPAMPSSSFYGRVRPMVTILVTVVQERAADLL
jgi:hypothetical protein